MLLSACRYFLADTYPLDIDFVLELPAELRELFNEWAHASGFDPLKSGQTLGRAVERRHRRRWRDGERAPFARHAARIANRLLRRVRDYAEVKGDGRITQALAQQALAMLDVDPLGLDLMDRKLLEAVVQRFDGGPVGLDNVAAAIGEEPGTIEDVIEPYLIQQGYLQRTPRGRIGTQAAYRHLRVAPPARGGGDLFAA